MVTLDIKEAIQKAHCLAFMYCHGSTWQDGDMFDIFNMISNINLFPSSTFLLAVPLKFLNFCVPQFLHL